MKQKLILLVLAHFLGFMMVNAQQILIDDSVPIEQLIEDNIAQNCVGISNATSTVNGSSSGLSSFGFFENGNSDFPFEDGIILSTGSVSSAGNVQNSDILNEGDSTWGTDNDLETVLGLSGTLNATSISFNYLSISNQLRFNYIFASEEYFGNFPCNDSDAFAILIRRAGTTEPFTNIALVPETTSPVKVNTIHDEIFGFCSASNEAYFEGYNLGDTNFNGRTTILSTTATIEPYVEYEIKFVIADQTDENYDSAVFIELSSFSASIDLGDDFSTCASDIMLDADIDNPSASYTWFFNGTEIPAVGTPFLNATQSGNYRVEIDIPFTSGSCVLEDDINVQLSSTQSSDPISDLNLCDDPSNDEIETFDVSEKNAEVLASVPASDYTLTYHLSANDAQNNSNAIAGPIQNTSNPQTIFVRIEDTNSGCLAFSSFNLVVNPLPDFVSPTPLVFCDDQTPDGRLTLDLNQLKDDEIKNGQNDLVVTYHSSVFNAQNLIDAFSMPYTNTNPNEQIFVSILDTTTGCNSITTLDLTVLSAPPINRSDLYLDACDATSPIANFNLTDIIPGVLAGLTDVTTSFHTTQNDAINGTNAILNETNFSNTTPNVQSIFIRVEDDDTGCISVATIELHTNLLSTGTRINDVRLCDEDNDNSEEFILSNLEIFQLNGIPNASITYYESEDDRNNQINAIDTSVNFVNSSNPQTLYLTVSNSTCNVDAEIELILFPILTFDSVVNVNACDFNQDGFVNIGLSQFDSDVTNNDPNFSVTYFSTETDAINNENELPNVYSNTENPFTLYTRITQNSTGCADTGTIVVTVSPAPEAEPPANIIICDADRDGFSNLNLIDQIPDSVLNTPNRLVKFYNTQSNAISDTSAIPNPSNYMAQTETIFIRVENTISGCFSLESFDITINTLPYVGDLSNVLDELTFCEDETDGIGEFIFENQDATALDGQTGKEVSYYLNQADADNKVNPIDKTTVFENTSNPQEIYIRIDNSSDETCYTTSSFIIEVGTNPEFNPPTNWIVCDDISNDGSEFFDLSAKVAEVSQGIPNIGDITFYLSEEDAVNSTNAIPLEFTNTVNPQQIFVQIDDGTICNSITSFVINVIQVPAVGPIEPLTQCADDGNQNLEFNLTDAESSILEVRQDNLDIQYYETLQDAETETNPIISPESYTNLTNPQTVYFKITNIVSNCSATYPISIVIYEPPVLNDFEIFNVCANDTNTVDLSEINQVAVDVNFNISFSYFATETDAIANSNPLDRFYTYTSNNDTLFVRAEFTTTGCSEYYEFTLNVNPLPIANQPPDLVDCDDNFDGLLEFDLSSQNAGILGNQDPDLFFVSYHNSALAAGQNNLPLETDYVAFNGEVIFARIENKNTGCYNVTQFTTLINPLPEVNIDNQVLCIDDLPLLVSARTNNPSHQYLWSTGETSPEIEITEIGTYAVTVTDLLTGCETTSSFDVTESETASIDFTEVIDFSDPNNITVTVSGIGDYVYQLDDFEPQESNVFVNVGLGYHTITIIDLNGCSHITREVLVVDFPKFFTPNNDGNFDTWHIVGIETLPGTVIQIFDRFGKLLKELDANVLGWDGTYNGNKMPTADYWYVANVVQNDQSFQVKGHFTLRR